MNTHAYNHSIQVTDGNPSNFKTIQSTVKLDGILRGLESTNIVFHQITTVNYYQI